MVQIGNFAVSWQSASLVMIAFSMLYVFIQMVKLMWPEKEHKYSGGTNDAGLYHGDGRLEAINGDLYEGEFVDGKFHGQGHYIFKTGGGSYKGAFKNGQFCGRGREVYPDGSCYEGDFLGGKRFRRGSITYSNGTKFSGDWQWGKKQGRGSMHYNDGTRFEGYFVDGKRQGLGVLRDGSGRKMIGEWADGRLLQRLDHLPYECVPRSACHDKRLLALLAVKEDFTVEVDTDMEVVASRIESERGQSIAKCIFGVMVLTEDGGGTRPVVAAPLPADGSKPITAEEALALEEKTATALALSSHATVAAAAAAAASASNSSEDAKRASILKSDAPSSSSSPSLGATPVVDAATAAAALAARVAAANGSNRRRNAAKKDTSSSAAAAAAST